MDLKLILMSYQIQGWGFGIWPKGCKDFLTAIFHLHPQSQTTADLDGGFFAQCPRMEFYATAELADSICHQAKSILAADNAMTWLIWVVRIVTRTQFFPSWREKQGWRSVRSEEAYYKDWESGLGLKLPFRRNAVSWAVSGNIVETAFPTWWTSKQIWLATKGQSVGHRADLRSWCGGGATRGFSVLLPGRDYVYLCVAMCTYSSV